MFGAQSDQSVDQSPEFFGYFQERISIQMPICPAPEIEMICSMRWTAGPEFPLPPQTTEDQRHVPDFSQDRLPLQWVDLLGGTGYAISQRLRRVPAIGHGLQQEPGHV